MYLPAVMNIILEDSKTSVRHLSISLCLINSTSSTNFSALMIQKYRRPLSPLYEREWGSKPSNHTRCYLIRQNRGNHQTTSVTNQTRLLWSSPYINITVSADADELLLLHPSRLRGCRNTQTDTHTHTCISLT